MAKQGLRVPGGTIPFLGANGHGLTLGPSSLPAAPTSVVTPAILGNPWIAQTLSATTGTWAGNPTPTFGYQWKRSGSPISGATSSTYQLVSADLGAAITVTVIGTNSQGSLPSTSSSVTAITAPLVTATPLASTFYLAEGDSITQGYTAGGNVTSYAALFAGTDTTDITFQSTAVQGNSWFNLNNRAGTDDALIASNPGKTNYVLSVLIGTNSTTSTFNQGDLDSVLASTSDYLDHRRTAGWKVALMTILPRADSNNKASIDYMNTVMRTWVGAHCDTLIDIAADPLMGLQANTANTDLYGDLLHPTPLGHRYLERIVAAGLSSLMTAAVAPAITSANITGTAQVGQTLTANAVGVTGTPTPTPSYQWKSNGTNVGTNASTYVPVSGDVGHTITVVITETNSVSSASATSSATGAVTNVSVPVISVAPGAPTGSTSVGSTLTASTGTWTNTPTSYAYQWLWGDTSADISGATSSTYVLVSGDTGHTIKVRVTAINAGGAGSPSTSAATASVTNVTAVTFDPAHSGTAAVLSNSNRDLTTSSGFASSRMNVSAASTGKLYLELLVASLDASNQVGIGLTDAGFNLNGYLGSAANSFMFWCSGAGSIFQSGFAVGAAPSFTSPVVGDKYGIAYDLGAGKAWVSKNGVFSGDPVAGTGAMVTWTGGSLTMWPAGTSGATTAKWTVPSSATYAAPSGYTGINA